MMSATTPGWKASRTSRPCRPLCRPPRWRDCTDCKDVRIAPTKMPSSVAIMSVKCNGKRAARLSKYAADLQSGLHASVSPICWAGWAA